MYSQVMHQSVTLFFMYPAFTGLDFVPLRLAVWFQAPGIFGLGGAQVSLTAVAMDRFLCIFVSTSVAQ